jgi:hypothetical protein
MFIQGTTDGSQTGLSFQRQCGCDIDADEVLASRVVCSLDECIRMGAYWNFFNTTVRCTSVVYRYSDTHCWIKAGKHDLLSGQDGLLDAAVLIT